MKSGISSAHLDAPAYEPLFIRHSWRIALPGLALASGGSASIAYGDRDASDGRIQLSAGARSILEFLGLTRLWSASANGDIPGAKFADATLFVRETKPVRFRSAAEMKALVERLSRRDGRPVVAYCNAGDWASGVWFVLHEIIGRKNTVLYNGSMQAWTRVPGRPLTRLSSELRRPH